MSSYKRIQASGDLRGTLRLTGAVELQAAASGKRPRFSTVAYTGGMLQLAGWYSPVVIDLATVKATQALPILRDHDAGRVIGHTTEVSVTAREIRASGVISAENADAADVVATASNGFPWQASIGANPGRLERVEPGTKVTVNGQTFTGPLVIARDTVLREISFVAIGADANTSATVAASSRGGVMTFEQWLQARGFDPASLTDAQRSALQAAYNREHGNGGDADPVLAERQRISRIDTICRGSWGEHAGRVEQIRQQAIAGTVTVEAMQAELLGMLRAARPTSPAIAGIGGIDQGQLLAAALCVAQGVSPQFLASHYGERVVDAAVSRPNRGMSVQGLLRQVIAAAGGHAPTGRFTDAGIRTAFEADRQLRASGFSSLSLPGILSDAANKLMLEAYTAAAVTWPKFCRTAANSDFKTHKRYRLTASGAFEEVGKAGELKHISLNESEYSNTLATYGAMIVLTRQDIINDDLGALGSVPRLLGRLGAVKVEKAVFTLLIGNANSFFGPTNGNYISGATTVLSAEGLRQALAVFREQTDSNGDPILVEPTVLVIPPALEAVALSLNNGTAIVLAGDTDVQLPDANVWKGKFMPVVAPFLAASAGLGGVDTNWYLTCGPSDYSPIEVAFLNGQQTPTVESADVDFNTLGVGMRGYFDFGVAFLDHRGGVKSKGAA